MKMLVPSICSLSFCQDPHLQAIHHSRFHCHLVNVPFLSCYYHSVTNSPWHLFPPVLPYLHFLLNLSCALSISLHGWPQVLKFIYLPYSCFLKLCCYSCLHVIWRCILSFFYSLFIPLLSRPYLCLPGPWSHYRSQCCLQTVHKDSCLTSTATYRTPLYCLAVFIVS